MQGRLEALCGYKPRVAGGFSQLDQDGAIEHKQAYAQTVSYWSHLDVQGKVLGAVDANTAFLDTAMSVVAQCVGYRATLLAAERL